MTKGLEGFERQEMQGLDKKSQKVLGGMQRKKLFRRNSCFVLAVIHQLLLVRWQV